MDCIYPPLCFCNAKTQRRWHEVAEGLKTVSHQPVYIRHIPSSIAVPRNAMGHGREEGWIVPARHMKMPDYKRKKNLPLPYILKIRKSTL